MNGSHRCEWSSGYGGEPQCEDAATKRVRHGSRDEFVGWFCDEHGARLVTYAGGRIIGDDAPFIPSEARRHLAGSTARDTAYSELLLRRATERVEALEAAGTVAARPSRRLEPLVNGIVDDPDGTHNLPHAYENLGEHVSDGFCRRCGRDRRAAIHEVTFVYTNHRGETSLRRVLPLRLEWGTTDWYPQPGWLLVAHDLDHGAERSFALTGVLSQPQLPVPAPAPLTEDDVPAEAWALLDRLAGRPHSEGGSVRSAVVELLNLVRRPS